MNRIALIVTAAAAFTLLSACGGTPAQTPVEPAPATQTVPPPTTLPAETESLPATEAPLPVESPATEAGSVGLVSFAANIMPIFEAKCVKCHGVERVKEGLDMQTYENIMAGSFNGAVVAPGNAAESLLVQLIVENEMPNRGPKITPDELQLIREWVNQGALNN